MEFGLTGQNVSMLINVNNEVHEQYKVTQDVELFTSSQLADTHQHFILYNDSQINNTTV